MQLHGNARTTPYIRREMVRRVRERAEPVTETAAALGVSANIADILPSVARSTMDPMDRIDRMRAALAHWLLSPLQGVTLGSWLRLLVDVRFAVDGRYWPRAGLTTLTAAANSVQALIERIVHGRELDRLKSATAKRPENRWAESESGRPEPSPVFILGHYRSGTTHLQNLFATDPRLAHPNSYQATFPRTFLTTEWLGARIGGHLTMRKRPHDDVRLDLQVRPPRTSLLSAPTPSSHPTWAGIFRPSSNAIVVI